MVFDKVGYVKGGFFLFGYWCFCVRGIFVYGGNDIDEMREDVYDMGYWWWICLVIGMLWG